MRDVVASIESEFLRFRRTAEGAMAQVPEARLSETVGRAGNSLAILAWHVAGNLASRFTDFLTTDGEKPWRKRDEEFLPRAVNRKELDAKWSAGWSVLLDTLAGLEDAELPQKVSIRGVPLTVAEALHRSLAHTSYHAGQIVFLSRQLVGDGWRYLSIPPGGSDEYNRNPTREKGR